MAHTNNKLLQEVIIRDESDCMMMTVDLWLGSQAERQLFVVVNYLMNNAVSSGRDGRLSARILPSEVGRKRLVVENGGSDNSSGGAALWFSLEVNSPKDITLGN